jgi:hypothetical protein
VVARGDGDGDVGGGVVDEFARESDGGGVGGGGIEEVAGDDDRAPIPPPTAVGDEARREVAPAFADFLFVDAGEGEALLAHGVLDAEVEVGEDGGVGGGVEEETVRGGEEGGGEWEGLHGESIGGSFCAEIAEGWHSFFGVAGDGKLCLMVGSVFFRQGGGGRSAESDSP